MQPELEVEDKIEDEFEKQDQENLEKQFFHDVRKTYVFLAHVFFLPFHADIFSDILETDTAKDLDQVQREKELETQYQM